MMWLRIGRFGGLLFLGSRRAQLMGNQPSIGGLTSSVTYPQTVAPVGGFAMKSGVYQIRNQVNGNRYIGSAVNLRARWRRHLTSLRREQHRNSHLQAAFNKYGESAFILSILKYVEDSSQLIPCEQRFLNTLKPEYNIFLIAGSPLGYRHSPEARRKISKALMGVKLSKEHCKKISEGQRGKSHPCKGHRHTEQTKRKLSEAARGRRLSTETRRKMAEAHIGKHPSDETRQKISDSLKGRRLSIETRRKLSEAARAYHRRRRREKQGEA